MLYLKAVSLEDGREFYDMLQRIGASENGPAFRREWCAAYPGCAHALYNALNQRETTPPAGRGSEPMKW